MLAAQSYRTATKQLTAQAFFRGWSALPSIPSNRGVTHAAASQPPNFFTDEVPAEFQLPPPPDPIARCMAGLVDMAVSGTLGALVGTAAFVGLDSADAGVWGSVLAGSLAFAGRDAVAGDGCGSFGKRLFGLRVIGWDQGIVSPSASVVRNAYFGLIPFFGVNDIVWHAFVFCAVWDVASQLVTQDARRAGDYLMGCRVASVSSSEASLDDLEVEEMSALLRRVTELSPDTARVLEAAMPYSPLSQDEGDKQDASPRSAPPPVETSRNVMLRHAAQYIAEPAPVRPAGGAPAQESK